MRGRLALLLALLVAVACRAGPLVRVEAIPREAWIGQRVVVRVDVLAEDAWAQLAEIGQVTVPGAYVLPPPDEGTRLQQTIDGRAYGGQRYEWWVYPQRAGRLRLSVPPVAVRVRRFGSAAGDRVSRIEPPAVTIHSRVPPGAEGIDGLISAAELSAEQQWQPDVARLRVGDALRRTVRLRVRDVPGMAFAPLRFAAVAGLGVYPSEAQVDDSYHRGSLTGARTEAVTYVAERPGDYTLPAIELQWWDIRAERLRRAVLPGRQLSVAVNPAVSPPAARVPWRAGAGWLLAAAGLALAGAALRRWRRSEPARFRALRRAVRRGHAAAIYRELMPWLDCLSVASRPARLDAFMARHGPPGTLPLLAQLERSLSSGEPLAEPRALLAALRRARASWRRSLRRAAADGVLAPLNPGGGEPGGRTRSPD